MLESSARTEERSHGKILYVRERLKRGNQFHAGFHFFANEEHEDDLDAIGGCHWSHPQRLSFGTSIHSRLRGGMFFPLACC
jgi:hypothetical protein